jgi:hypothetical protein
MPRATCDLPRPPKLSPDESVCFTAVVMALADLLVERELFTREQLEIRAQQMIENPDMLSAADFVKAVADRIFQKKYSEQFKKVEPDTTGVCPTAPGRR